MFKIVCHSYLSVVRQPALWNFLIFNGFVDIRRNITRSTSSNPKLHHRLPFGLQLSVNLSCTKHVTVSCWKCNSYVEFNNFFCDKCLVIQKPSNAVDFYQLLGIQYHYDVNETTLTNNFRRIQMLLHPDKFSVKSSEEKSIAAEYSALVNEAYTTLRNPCSRGIYLLQRLGVPFDENLSVEDHNLLLEVMELNEKVVEAEDVKVLNSIKKKNKIKIVQIIKSISRAFQDKNLEAAKKELVKLRYYTNLESKISEKQLKIDITE